MDFGDDTFHVEFGDKANRAASLARHLDSAVQLSDKHLYGPAFTVLRSGLEHAVFDWLVFLGDTYVIRMHAISDETWADWQRDRETGADWAANVHSWTRTKKGDVIIRWHGILSAPDERGKQEKLSIYYFLIDEYDGLLGRPAEQDDDDGFLTRDELRRRAQENEARWNVYLRWSALLSNLVENNLADEDDAGRLSVHYRFLSTFAHPVTNADVRLYGRGLDDAAPRFDHYSSELVLLYAIAIAALELRTYSQGVKERLGVEVADDEHTLEDLRNADQVAGYFWFLGNNPHSRDVHDEANRRSFRRLREGGTEPVVIPELSEVPFPRDPLTRLARQHISSYGRVAGTAYTSPWPRNDAFGRG
ncbi:hypothetical protein AB0E44_13660 [Micrococcus terreus]|uniref:hypothetical protein n=1 Tax=Micrococcus terreus TaxID=574650 RepID=UPI0033FC4833